MQFVTEDGRATGLEDDDRRAGINGSREDFKRALQVLFSIVEHAEIVERTAAARLLVGNRHRESGTREDIERRLESSRMKVVVESIHPQDNFAGTCRRCRARGFSVIFSRRLQETRRSERGNFALRSQAQRGSQDMAETWRVAQKIGEARGAIRRFPAICRSCRTPVCAERIGDLLS